MSRRRSWRRGRVGGLRRRGGFVLIAVSFLLLFLATTALFVNRRASVQLHAAQNLVAVMQEDFGVAAATAYGAWRIGRDPGAAATALSGEIFVYAGSSFRLTGVPIALPGFPSAIRLLVDGNGMQSTTVWDMRFDAVTILIADTGNHRIRLVQTNGVVATVAGTGSAGYGGDGAPATAAVLNGPLDVCRDAAGRVWIADTGNHRIRRIEAGGTMVTVAGTGTAGFAGDGGAATAARLSSPSGLALDAAGNLYFSDTANRRVRRISPAGIITTVAGPGSGGTSGSQGNDGPATAARLSEPRGLDVVGNNLFLTDRDHCQVRRVDLTTGIITRFHGSLSGANATCDALNQPWDCVVTPQAAGYVTDGGRHRVRLATGATTASTAVNAFWEWLGGGYWGDGGAAWWAGVNRPRGIARTQAGDVYIADTDNHAIRRIDGVTGDISTVAGLGSVPGFWGDGGQATLAGLRSPSGVAVLGVFAGLVPMPAAY